MTKTLTDELQAQEDFVDAVIAEMERVGIGQIGRTIVSKALRPILQGIVVAHVNDASSDEVEDAITNVFLLGIKGLMKRKYTTRDAVIKATQAILDQAAVEMGNNIDLDFPNPPKFVIPKSRMN